MKLGAVAKLYKTNPNNIKNYIITGLKLNRIPYDAVRTLTTITNLGKIRHDMFLDMAKKEISIHLDTIESASRYAKEESSRNPRVNALQAHKAIELVDNLISGSRKRLVSKRDGSIATLKKQNDGRKTEARTSLVWLTRSEYQKFAGVSYSVVRRMEKDGTLKTRIFGKVLKVRTS